MHRFASSHNCLPNSPRRKGATAFLPQNTFNLKCEVRKQTNFYFLLKLRLRLLPDRVRAKQLRKGPFINWKALHSNRTGERSTMRGSRRKNYGSDSHSSAICRITNSILRPNNVRLHGRWPGQIEWGKVASGDAMVIWCSKFGGKVSYESIRAGRLMSPKRFPVLFFHRSSAVCGFKPISVDSLPSFRICWGRMRSDR